MTTATRCMKCESYCEGACYELVPTIKTQGDYYFVGKKPRGSAHASCEDCGGKIEYDENKDRYACGGYLDMDGYDDSDSDNGPCGRTYLVLLHEAYDTIY